MKIRRRSSNLLIEPPSSATGDIAFNLIVFFLVCASVQPDSGRHQTLPRSEETEQKEEKDKNIEVVVKRQVALVNGDPVQPAEFQARLAALLAGKPRPEDKVVVVKSDDDVPYHFWMTVTSQIEDAGGIITLQIEEEREVQVP
ncbi:MAG TPA: biopolymer transporter ExbD [Planctomycetaceae bacterium]|nr:biopolymer transporter ExbD [Planctomycetaceae bacterium]HCD02335.1 biopolymer transporter ExbD [Planctomycetaceae bacterium]|tara:strand:- start:1246 stop:1674 length:429 start_codon:yes stop_codon:yes gene_type:complete